MIENAIIEKLPANRSRSLPVMTARALDASVADEQLESHSELESKPGANGPNQIWKPGVWVRLPWLGFGSLFAILLRRFLLHPSFGAQDNAFLIEDLC